MTGTSGRTPSRTGTMLGAYTGSDVKMPAAFDDVSGSEPLPER
jgi:hypothetical protein